MSLTEQPLHPTRTVGGEREFDTRTYLRNASRQAEERNYAAFTIVDVDAHHYETESWNEIVDYLDDAVLRHYAQSLSVARLAPHTALLPVQFGNQDVSGRIRHYSLRGSEHAAAGEHRDVTIVKRVMESIGIDFQILFPTPMLALGMHPNPEIEAAVARAYARWLIDRILTVEPAVKGMLYLPFNEPLASLRIVDDFGDAPGVVGFMVTSVRHRPVQDNAYMKLYRAIEERGKPLGFHAGYNWQERSTEILNRFISVHALTFPWYNMVHITNWIVNGLPERFPNLKVIWIEGGLAWVPFLMQRLDHEYQMRSSEAPLLKDLPSEYMKRMYYTSQPMERPRNLRTLEMTFEMMNAETQLMYSSDYPHWDFDLPSRIYDLPFLDESAKRAILGRNACRLFGLPSKDDATDRAGAPSSA
jgi:predicted TIM-barrel fold metal-dependent hydrolase